MIVKCTAIVLIDTHHVDSEFITYKHKTPHLHLSIQVNFDYSTVQQMSSLPSSALGCGAMEVEDPGLDCFTAMPPELVDINLSTRYELVMEGLSPIDSPSPFPLDFGF